MASTSIGDSVRPDPHQATPIYRQLYQRFRAAMLDGRLAPGARVPSVRSLASELNLSRGTVELAYQLLVSEGYLLPRGPAGTIVSPRLPRSPVVASEAATKTPSSVQPTAGALSPPPPLRLGLPSLDAFPAKSWTRLTLEQLRAQAEADLHYPPAAGHPVLREALVSYLGVSRGIVCRPEQIVITNGYRDALGLICQTLLAPEDLGWFEEPGYFIARERLLAAGMRLAPVKVDAGGLDVKAGCREAEQARFAVVTPTHQSPTGVTLTLERRRALLAWASRRQAWIIEDDYDSEFRYRGHPIPALKSLDHDDRVLYTGTFSKVLFPGLRLAYLVVPTTEIARFHAVLARLGHGCPNLSQSVVAEFMAAGHFARHLKRMRALYRQRRELLHEALVRHLGGSVHINLQAGGMHLLAELPEVSNDAIIARRARESGLGGHALSEWYLGRPQRSGLLLSFTNLKDARQTDDLMRRLARIVETTS
ncbi:MocR-like pyridoxine biosynthesis transcription factor PdxR [Salinicola rhizosphaerae]|uniref:GntR family transcriptional regulator n=1 Tax=Salinicola rhizosphaerae TaxID=1443141 RepID=A0ABQ3ELF8_9GAMM|nr:PLP-dependent aminotransferase family protein [Salinicola rhizosphaerae]GHB34350.1 GntR family transcriptional regulator [Salinicola rhizosphaerae]